MLRPFSANAKNPMHPSALRIGDINPGRTIVTFNTYRGLRGPYVVLGRPFVGYAGEACMITDGRHPIYSSQKKEIVVLLRDETGARYTRSLVSLGVIPYSHSDALSWDAYVEVAIDHRKVHLLSDMPILLSDYTYSELESEYEDGYFELE